MNARVEIWYKLEKKDNIPRIHNYWFMNEFEIWQRKIEIKQEAIDVYFDKVSGWKWISTIKSLRNNGPTLRRKRKELGFFFIKWCKILAELLGSWEGIASEI